MSPMSIQVNLYNKPPSCKNSIFLTTILKCRPRQILLVHSFFRTNNRTSLQNHIKRHDPEKHRKHVCRVCNKGFIEKAKWRAHELTHTDLKPFVCELCGRKLRSLNNYNLHMMTLHGRKHTCDICGNDYPRLLGLAQHKRDAHGVSDGIL